MQVIEICWSQSSDGELYWNFKRKWYWRGVTSII